MKRLNKKHLIFVTLMFFIFSHKVNADIVINEVQISPTEERFIELYNNGSSSVDLTDWYIQRKTSTGSTYGSLVSKTNFIGKVIDAGSYFVVSKTQSSNSDISVDSLTLTESNSIQLKNKEGDVIYKIGWGDSNDCGGVCAPNPTEGKSIQRNSSLGWEISSPTPRSSNIINSNEETNDDQGTSSGNVESSSDSSSSKQEVKVYKITTKIISPKTVVAGIPFDFDHQTFGIKKEKVILGKFVWNFGDGMTKTGEKSDPFSYIYQYPGEYVVTLSFYESIFNTKPDATDRLIIKVIPSSLSISSVGSPSDPYIELENNSNYEMSLRGFVIKGLVHSFVVPEEMVILPNRKLKISPKITGFDFGDIGYLFITDSSGQIFATYPKQKTSTYKYSNNKKSEESIGKTESTSDITTEPQNQVIDLNDLSASVEKSDFNLNNKYFIYLSLFGVIFIGIISIILFRRKDEIPDYVEGGISAKDMTIIE